MANTKISQLPSWTGTAADLRWFVMNNSGENETFKFSGYTSPFRKGDTTDSIVSNNIATNKVAGPSDFVQGSSNQIQTTGGYSLIIGSDSNTITSAAAGYNTIVGSFGCVVNNNYGSNVYASRNSTAGGYFAGILSSNESSVSNGRASVIVGGEGNNLQGQYNGTLAGKQLTNNSWYSVVLGGFNNSISSTAAELDAIIVGDGNTISSTGKHNVLIASTASTITSGSNIIGLGLIDRTSLTQNNTTFVENAHAFRTYSTTVQSVSSGSTFTCNLNNGGKAQFYLTANTTIDITNVRDGQSFIIKTQTNGNYTITWTATGYTFVFEGGTKDPGNTTTDLFVFEVFGSVIYGNRRHNYS